MAEETDRQKIEALDSQMTNERSSFIPLWRDLGDYILPRRCRFFVSDNNRGDRRNQKIIDSTATLAARTLRSGMMAGVTSPARPWFRLTTPDPGLAEFESVKEWLYGVTQRMSTVFIRSNLYNALPIVYGDIGVFATAAMGMEEDFEDVVRFYPFPVGSYKISNNEKFRVDAISRDMQMRVRQIVEKFCPADSKGKRDLSVLSNTVKTAWERGDKEMRINICHVILPNENYRPEMLASKFKRYRSVYYESGNTENKFLRDRGYDRFPVLCPRWEVTGEDVYGTDCPGMTVIGDVKQLQVGEKKSGQAIEKSINPPLQASTGLRERKISLLPGDVTFHDDVNGQQGVRPIHQVNASIKDLEFKQSQVRERVRRGFYEDLFLMLSTSDRRDITAREIEERHEEKLLALGPVLEQLNQDLLDPLIDGTFQIMLNQGLIPPPPEELYGQKLKVEYVSVMAQAQKLVGVSGIERFSAFVGNLAKVDTSVLDKIDLDQTVDVYGDMTSVPPGIVRSDEKVQAIRSERARAQKAQADAEAARAEAAAVKDLSKTEMGGDNALTRLLQKANAGSLEPTGGNV